MRYTTTLILSLFVFSFSLMPGAAHAQEQERSLYAGLSGSDVTAMQNRLIKLGYLAAGNATGIFGPKTDAALKKFQCDKKVVCAGAAIGYGVYGPKTREALTRAAAVPATITGRSLTGPATGAFEVSGWIPYWRIATGTADVLPHLDKLTSVMPFGYTMKSDGTLVDTAHLEDGTWDVFFAEARKRKVRIVPTVMWGNGDTIHRVLSDPQKRVALEDEIAAKVKKFGYDGIDIDFEAKKHETMDYFSLFLKGLYQRMGNKWVYCTIEARMPLEDRYSPGAKIPEDAQDYANDFAEMNKYCDRVEVMAYDQGTIAIRLNKARLAPYAPTADPGWVESIVTLAAQSIARNKLVIGIPSYGYEYTVTPLPSGGYQYKVLWPFNYRYATDIAQKLGITPQRNSANEIGFSYDPAILEAIAPTGGETTQTQQVIAPTSVAENAGSQVNTGRPFNYLSWSDATAIKDKVELARRLGVRGVAVFKFDGGEDQAMWGVLK